MKIRDIINIAQGLWCVLFHLSDRQKKDLDMNKYVLCYKCNREYPAIRN